jgi:hypothetical protein
MAPIELPAIQIAYEKAREGSKPHDKALMRWLAFADSADQLRLHRYEIPRHLLGDESDVDEQDTVQLVFEPWTPLFFDDATMDLVSRREAAAEMADSKVPEGLGYTACSTCAVSAGRSSRR